MDTRRDVFQAIADPTRRAIINMLAQQPQNVNAIADQFDVTRQAISLHVKILNECGLIRIKKQGRERVCEASLQHLQEVQQWIDQYKKFWETKLDALGLYLNEMNTEADAPK